MSQLPPNSIMSKEASKNFKIGLISDKLDPPYVVKIVIYVQKIKNKTFFLVSKK